MLPIGAETGIGSDLLAPLGGAAAILALLGMALILPLFVSQRREISRLRAWHERDPEAGDSGEPEPATAGFAALRGTGPMTPAERVTSERPALERIGTSERAALELEAAPFWKRVIIRGPRHPLVISVLALVVAAGIFSGAVLLIRAGDEGTPAVRGIDKASFQVVVLNASPFPGLAGNVADDLEAAKFVIGGSTSAPDSAGSSTVRYADGFAKEARAVARRLNGIPDVEPFNSQAEAAAEGAAIVVVVAEDLADNGGSLDEEPEDEGKNKG